MKKYMELILELLASFFNSQPLTEQNRIWGLWLGLDPREREYHDLIDLLKSQVREEFKARAIIILLVPSHNLIPFKWEKMSSTSLKTHLSIGHCKWLNSLSPNLLRFTAKFVCGSIDFINSTVCNEDGDQALYAYNELVIQLLGLVKDDDELSQQLFDRFEINDPVAFANMDDASGYTPISRLFRAEKVPEKWKLLADQQLREKILSEVKGESVPREDWENALKCYAEIIGYPNNSEIEYSKEMFASQMKFILDLPGVDDLRLFRQWQTGNILGTLKGPENFEVRHRFARHMVLGDHSSDKFMVYSGTQDAAQAMFAEFHNDIELRNVLEQLISKAKENEEEEKQREQQKQSAHAAVMAQMI